MKITNFLFALISFASATLQLIAVGRTKQEFLSKCPAVTMWKIRGKNITGSDIFRAESMLRTRRFIEKLLKEQELFLAERWFYCIRLTV